MLLHKLFSGEFTFQRRVSKPQIDLFGTANFETNDGMITYRENGQYSLAGKLLSFYQNRIFIVEKERLLIYKNDCSLLHEFQVNHKLNLPLELSHNHQCASDQYSLTLSIHSFDNFSTSYHIKGPNKEYRIHTNFERV